MMGLQAVTEATRRILGAVREEGAGPRVTEAAASLERAWSIAPTAPLDKPVARLCLVSHPPSPARLDMLSVEELMEENAGFEDSAWRWVEVMVREGYHDDGEMRRGLVVLYLLQDREGLVAQAREWAAANPALVAGLDLDLGILDAQKGA